MRNALVKQDLARACAFPTAVHRLLSPSLNSKPVLRKKSIVAGADLPRGKNPMKLHQSPFFRNMSARPRTFDGHDKRPDVFGDFVVHAVTDHIDARPRDVCGVWLRWSTRRCNSDDLALSLI